MPKFQRIINSTITRSTKYNPFEFSNIPDIKSILEDPFTKCIMGGPVAMSEEAKQNILYINEENYWQFKTKRKQSRKYEVSYHGYKEDTVWQHFGAERKIFGVI